MKRTTLPHSNQAGSRIWATLLAAALLAGPALAAPSAAAEPAPNPAASPAPTGSKATPAGTTPSGTTPSGAVPGAATPTATPTVSPKPATVPAPAPAPAPTPAAAQAAQPAQTTTAAPDPNSAADRAAMGVAVGPGAAMGQDPAGKAARAATQSLTAQAAWSPSFGVHGLDVSSHQPSVNWQTEWNRGARFAYVKASEGNYFTNPLFSSQYQGSRNVGMIRGAYHFAIPNWSSGANQARYFVANGGGWSADGYTMPPVLDFEFNPYEGRTINGFKFGNTCYDMTPAQLRSWVRDFGDTMLALTGRLPVIYTNTGWWNYCLGTAPGFGDYPLWVAAYPGAPTDNAGPVPSSWATYSIWQYSSTGPFPGDSNIWNGDYESLRKFAGAASPAGSFDGVSVTRSGSETSLRVTGWAVDRSVPATAIPAHVYVTDPSGTTTGYAWTANKSRPDVDQAYGYGAAHGFDGTIKITASGTYKVCAHAIGKFENTALGCKSVQASGVEAKPAQLPVGSYDSLALRLVPNSARLVVTGWALDPSNSSASIPVHVYVRSSNGGNPGYAFTANKPRADVNSVLGATGNHGFSASVPIGGPGTYTVCAYAISVAPVPVGNPSLGCSTIAVPSTPATMGYLDSATLRTVAGKSSISVTGWTLDPVFPAVSIPDHVYITYPDGSRKGFAFTANLKRPDVNSALATVGNHGFVSSVPVTQRGTYEVCAFGVAASPLSAANSLLGCRSLTY